MATTRIESGSVPVRQVSGVPMTQVNQQQTNYMFAANVQSQEAGTLSRILDDMRATVLEFSGKKRMEEGLRYVAENPVTREQIELAAGGIISPTLGGGIGKLSGDLPSFFNQAVREARSAELTSHFLVEGKTVISRLQNNLENNVGNVTPETIKKEIDSVTKGLSKTLSAVDPVAAIKFQASMAAHGNLVLNASYESQLKKNKEINEIKFYGSVEDDKKRIEQVLKYGDSVDKDTGLPITVDDRLNQIRGETLNAAITLGDGTIFKEHIAKIDSFILDAKINVITKSLIDDESMTLEKIRTANIGKYSNLLKTLDQNSAAKITVNYMTAVNYRNSEAKDLLQQKKTVDQKEFVGLYNEVLQLPENSPARRKKIDTIAEIAMRNPDAVPLGVLKDLRDPPKGEGNAQVNFNLRRMIFDNKITNPDQIWAMTKQGLSSTQAVAALELYYRTDKQDQNELEKGISQRAGIQIIPGALVTIDSKGYEFKKRQEYLAQSKEIEAKYARDQLPPPTARQILAEIDSNIEKQRNSEAAKAARKSLETFEKLPWIGSKITRSNVKSLEFKAKTTLEKQQLKRINDLLNEAGE